MPTNLPALLTRIAEQSVTPQRAFLGNLLLQAREYRDEAAVAKYQEAVMAVGAEMFSGQDQKLFTAVQELLDENKLPTAATVLRLKLPGFSAQHANHYLDAAGESGEWDTYLTAIRNDYRKRVLSEAVAAAAEALKRGLLDEAAGLLEVATDAASVEAAHGLVEVRHFQLDTEIEPRIPTPWPRLNEHLGGGLGFEGNAVVSLWVGDSGIGKGTLLQQMIPFWLSLGHYVAYFFGEGQAADIKREVVRFKADLGYAELRLGTEKKVPRVLDQYQKAATALLEAPGKLFVMDEEFDGQQVRTEARKLRRTLAADLESGIAIEGAKLIVIIDNIDSAVSFDSQRHQREDQAYEYEARRFEQAAKRDGYHLAVLSQTNDEGAKRDGPPGSRDIARAKVLRNRAAFIVTLHRPVTEADKSALNRDGEPGRRAQTWVAVRKARGGLVDELEFNTEARTGRWFDPQQAAF